MRLLLAVLFVMLPCVPANAGGCRSCGYQTPYQATYTPPVYIAAFVQPIYVPAVFTTYQPAALSVIQTTQLTTVERLQAIAPDKAAVPVVPVKASPCQHLEERLKLLEKIVNPPTDQPLRKEAAPAPKEEALKPRTSLDGLSVLVNRCAACHEESKAKEKGGGHTYFVDGKLTLTTGQLNGVYKQLLKGAMPPDGRLSAEEGAAVMSYLDSFKVKE